MTNQENNKNVREMRNMINEAVQTREAIPLNQDGVRSPEREGESQGPLNVDGIRPPSGGLNK